MEVFLITAIVGYLAATILYLFYRKRVTTSLRWPILVLIVAAICHFLVIGADCYQGNHPFASVYQATSLASWITVLAFLAVSAGRRPMRELGAAFATFALVILVLNAIIDPHVVQNPSFSPMLVRIHIVMATLGVAGFCVEAGLAGLYLSMEKRLRGRDFRSGMSGLSLRGLDELRAAVVIIVTPIFAGALLLGGIALIQAGGWSMLAERTLELIAGLVAFVSSLLSLAGRLIWGLRGRKAAWLTMLGFVSMILILFSYGFRS